LKVYHEKSLIRFFKWCTLKAKQIWTIIQKNLTKVLPLKPIGGLQQDIKMIWTKSEWKDYKLSAKGLDKCNEDCLN